MSELAKHSVSVAGVIVNDEGQVLLIRRRDNGHWEPPGGVLELGEQVVEGLRREIREETGLEIEPLGLTGVYKHMTRGVVALVFRCRPVGASLTANEEVASFRWTAPEEVPLLVERVFGIRVADALTNKVPAIRAHDGRSLL